MGWRPGSLGARKSLDVVPTLQRSVSTCLPFISGPIWPTSWKWNSGMSKLNCPLKYEMKYSRRRKCNGALTTPSSSSFYIITVFINTPIWATAATYSSTFFHKLGWVEIFWKVDFVLLCFDILGNGIVFSGTWINGGQIETCWMFAFFSMNMKFV